jgi:cyanate permease
VGGTVVQSLLARGSWRDVFMFGAWATAVFVPLVWLLVPETVAFLDRARPPGALERINRVLARFGHAAAPALSIPQAAAARRSLADIFKPGLVVTTIVITCAYFAHVTSFYYILKWVPKIVVDMGFTPKAAAGVLTWANVGGAAGGAVFGLIAARTDLKRLTFVTLILGSAMIVWFGAGVADLNSLSVRVGVACMFSNSAIVGFYSLFARVFPTHVRATGTGFAVGVGRGGAALAPVCAGYLFQAGFGLQTVSIVMAAGSLIAAAALLGIKDRRAD